MLPHGTPYLYRPHLDPSLAQFRVMHDGGMVTKVPNGDGFVFLQVKEASREEYLGTFRALGLDLSALAKDPVHPADISREGYLAKVLVDNRSRARFWRDWGDTGKVTDLMLNTCHDLEQMWYPRSWPGAQRILPTTLLVGPGEVKEHLMLFRPDGEVGGGEVRVHGSHVTMMFLKARFRVQEGMDEMDVPFPFFDPHRVVPNATVVLSFSADPDPREKGHYVLPGMQVLRSEDGDERWMTEGYVRFEAHLSEGTVGAYVPAFRTRPGKAGNLPPGRIVCFDTEIEGYLLPHNLVVSNPQRPTGGRGPSVVKGWQPYKG